jgi:outer membrane autotransporter protein
MNTISTRLLAPLLRRAVAIAIVTSASLPSHADIRTVDQPETASSGTDLRLAIKELAGGGTIAFTGDALNTNYVTGASTLDGSMTLSSGTYALNPGGASHVVISGNNTTLLFSNTTGDVNLALDNITLTGGRASGGASSGGVLYLAATAGAIRITSPDGATPSGTLAIMGNYAGASGGAFYTGTNVNTNIITLGGSHGAILIQSNTANANHGGAFYMASGNIILDANTSGLLSLSNNFAGQDGGALRATTVSINGSHGDISIQNNRGGRNGGVAYLSTNFTLTATTSGSTVISNNHASGTGGVLFSLYGATITLEANGGPVVFSGNTQGADNTPNAIYAHNNGNTSNHSTLVLGGDGDILFYDPIYAQGIGNTLNKNGAGAALFSGSNAWRGASNVNAGSLLVNTGAVLDTLDTTTAPVPIFTVAAGALVGTHGGSGTGTITSNTFSLSGILYAGGTSTLLIQGASILNDITVYADVYTGNRAGLTILDGAATFNGTGKVDLQSVSAASGTFNILRYDGGIAAANFSGTLYYQGNIVGTVQETARMSGSVGISSDGKHVQVILPGVESNYVTWSGSSSENWDLTSSNWKIGTIYNLTTAVGDHVSFDDTSFRQTVSIGGSRLDVGALIISNTTVDYTFRGSGGIYAAGSNIGGSIVNSSDANIGKLVKTGSGKLVFENTSANIFEKGIDWHDGIISITNGNQLGVGDGAALNILNISSTLQVAGSGSSTLASPISFATGAVRTLTVDNAGASIMLAGVISGSGNLVLTGSGVTALTGENTFVGTTTLPEGSALALGQDADLGVAENTLVIGGNTSLQITGSFATVRSFNIGAHNLALSTTGDNELILNGASGQLAGTGTITLSGKLHASAAGVLGATTSWNIAATGRLAITGNQTIANLHNTGTIAFRRAAQGGQGGTLTASTLSGAGVIAMNIDFAAGIASRLIITGEAAGAHSLELTSEGTAANPNSINIPLVTYATGNPVFDPVSITDGGMNAYETRQAGNSVSLVYAGGSPMGNAILATAGVLAMDWHYSLDSLYNRMGDLHTKHPATSPGASDNTNNTNNTDNTNNNFWVRASGYHLNAGLDVSGDAFDQDTVGLTAGIDKGFALSHSTFYAGAFLATSYSDRHYDTYGKGTTGGIGAGLYATWLHELGWYVDFAAKADRYKNDLDTRDGGTINRIRYTNYARGLSLELGKRITIGRRFWFEPSAQAAIAWLGGKSYDTTTWQNGDSMYATRKGLRVELDDATAAQYRMQLRAGVNLGKWRPYAKFGEVKSDTDGGTIRAAGGSYDPQFDGWRLEAGAGVGYFITASSQLYLDYEYNKATQYERPWSFNLGYRCNW